MKDKEKIMTLMILGMVLFFVGAIVYKVFPSSETDLFSYKASATLKLIGLGFLVISMLVGGIILKDIDRNMKLLLLILGLILLLIYTIGSPSLEWKLKYDWQTPYSSKPTGYGIPGFEIPLLVISLLVGTILLKRKIKR